LVLTLPKGYRTWTDGQDIINLITCSIVLL